MQLYPFGQKTQGQRHQGKRATAHQLLAPIYHWFTEAYDTADLHEAQALLAELS